MPEIGDIAPDFNLLEDYDQRVALSDFRGRKVLIFFHPFSYTEICEGEICELRDDRSLVPEGVEILSIACDAWPIRKAYKEQLGANGRFLADFWPHGEVSRAYGVFDEDWGTCMRGTFLVDEEGVITHRLVNMGIADRRDQSIYKEWLAGA